MPEPGRVVILNGASSAGKTTLARAFREARAAAGECWLIIALDDYFSLLPHQWFSGGGHHGPFTEDGVQMEPTEDGLVLQLGELGRRLFATYRRTAALWARCGFDVIVDEVAFDEEAARDWQQALDGLGVTWVSVRCARDVAERREQRRGDRMIGMARSLSDVVHRYAPSDVVIDTTEMPVAESLRRLVDAVPPAPRHDVRRSL